MNEPRFDIIYGPQPGQARIEHHFCREWFEGEGCYGTNPEHGLSWEKARKNVADHLRDLADRWEETSIEEWRARGGPA